MNPSEVITPTAEVDKLTYFKSVNLFKGILEMFPGSVKPEISEVMNDGIPTEYIIRMFGSPFNVNMIVTELLYELVLFANIVNEELYSDSGVQTDLHDLAMSRTEPASAQFNPGPARWLMTQMLRSASIDYMGNYEVYALSLEAIEAWKKMYFSAVDNLQLSDFNGKFRIAEMSVNLPTIVGYILISASKEQADLKFLKKWSEVQKQYLQVRKMVSLYYTPEEREAALLKAQLNHSP